MKKGGRNQSSHWRVHATVNRLARLLRDMELSHGSRRQVCYRGDFGFLTLIQNATGLLCRFFSAMLRNDALPGPTCKPASNNRGPIQT